MLTARQMRAHADERELVPNDVRGRVQTTRASLRLSVRVCFVAEKTVSSSARPMSTDHTEQTCQTARRLLRQSVLPVAEVRHDTKASAEGAHVGTQGGEGDHIELAPFDSRYAGLADTHDVGDLLLGAVLLGTNLSQVPGADVVISHLTGVDHVLVGEFQFTQELTNIAVRVPPCGSSPRHRPHSSSSFNATRCSV